MQNKLKPGDTFDKKVGDIAYKIKVMSVGDRLDAEDKIESAKDAKTAAAHYRAWLDIVSDMVVSWDHERPISDIRYVLDSEGLGDLLDAVLAGNTLSESEAKN